MKKMTWRFAGLAAMLLLLSGCMIMDYAPVYLTIQVVDPEGKDLLAPGNNSWVEGTTVTFGDQTEMLQWPPRPETKAFGPIIWEGFKLVYNDAFKRYHLTLGMFDGSEKYDMTFVVHWPDDTEDVIEYKRGFMPVVRHAHENWKLNGKKVKDAWVMKIVKETPINLPPAE